MRYWRVSCPNCNTTIASGTGNGDNLPNIFITMFRCKICGTLVLTGKNEYLTMPVEERTNFRNTGSNCELIRQSLDRTCNKEYIAVLENNGFEIFPLEERDYEKFPSVNFAMYENRSSSASATQELYNTGVLIREEDKDKTTGGVKKEVLEENRRKHNNVTINKWSAGVGLAVGILFFFVFGSINPNSALALIGVAMGFASGIITYFLLKNHYKKQEKNSLRENKNMAAQKSNTSSVPQQGTLSYVDVSEKENKSDEIVFQSNISIEDAHREYERGNYLQALKMYEYLSNKQSLDELAQIRKKICNRQVNGKATVYASTSLKKIHQLKIISIVLLTIVAMLLMTTIVMASVSSVNDGIYKMVVVWLAILLFVSILGEGGILYLRYATQQELCKRLVTQNYLPMLKLMERYYKGEISNSELRNLQSQMCNKMFKDIK